MSVGVTIVEVMEDEALFRPWFKDEASWRPWKTFLRVLFALPLSAEDLDLYRRCTGRQEAPQGRVEEAWLCVGRRGGKSLILALIGVFLAVFRDWSADLVPGELALISILAADRRQSRSIYKYARAMLSRVPLLADILETSTDEEIVLSNGIALEIGTPSWRTIRGSTIIATLADEIAVWRTDDSANPDHEILAAVRPAMATIPQSLLLCASSPYAKRGEMWETFRRSFGKPDPVLVWRADTLTMHPSLPRRIIDRAYERDAVAAASEYGRDGDIQFRSDLESYVAREAAEAAVVRERFELPPVSGITYRGFTDAAGGSGGDSFSSAVAHRDRESGVIVVDSIREQRPPFSPEKTVAEHAAMFQRYGVRRIKSDRWGGEFPPEQFRKHGVECEVSEKTKSDLYTDFLPALNSGQVELLDHARLLAQLCALERRTVRSGKDSIDHPPGAHDDVINAVAGACFEVRAARSPMKISDDVLSRARTFHSGSRGERFAAEGILSMQSMAAQMRRFGAH